MCLYPKLIQNRKYTSTKKNGGQVPPLPLIDDKERDQIRQDKRVLLVPVACGKCMECMKAKSREWQVRLQEEIRHDKKGIFVTLTFNTESIIKLRKEIKGLNGYDAENAMVTLAVRRFLERWRKKYKKSVKHWLITELGHGKTEHIHIHGIIWTDKGGAEIEKIWGYGYTWDSQRGKDKDGNNGYVNERTINYITKYVNKVEQTHKYYKPKILTSSGIGKNYIERHDSKRNKYNGLKTNENYKTRQGRNIKMPIYYRNKIYTEQEREELWLNKLDEETRYIGGEKIDISKNEDDYYQTLEHYRQINNTMGYGTNEIDWERRNYENQRRNILFKERLKNR